MQKRKFLLKLTDRAFEAIRSGTKRIEIRANKQELKRNFVGSMKEGDLITFKKKDSTDTLKCTVKRKALYPTVRELLLKEGTKHTLSSTDDLEEGIRSIESIGNYKKIIAENGVFAIEIKDVRIS